MTINPKSLSIIVVGILFGSITLVNIIGRWDSEFKPQSATKISHSFAAQNVPADINNSHTFGDIDKLYNIPTPILAKAFNLPAETNITAFTIKELETIYIDQDIEISTGAVQLFVVLYNGLDFETTEQVYLPLSAADMLISRRALAPEQVEFMDAYALILDPTFAAVSATDNRAQTEERSIKGKTTFQELLDWGLSQESIEQIIGELISSSRQVVKDYCSEKGLDFEEIKLALQEEMDKLGHNH